MNEVAVVRIMMTATRRSHRSMSTFLDMRDYVRSEPNSARGKVEDAIYAKYIMNIREVNSKYIKTPINTFNINHDYDIIFQR